MVYISFSFYFAVTTKPTPTKKPATKTTTQKPTEAPEISTQEGYTIIVPTSQPASINRTENTIYVQSSSEKVGLIAGIVVVVVAIVFAVIGVVCYVLYRRYTNRSVKSMNFDNPVYKKTVEDHQFIIPSSNPVSIHLSLFTSVVAPRERCKGVTLNPC